MKRSDIISNTKHHRRASNGYTSIDDANRLMDTQTDGPLLSSDRRRPRAFSEDYTTIDAANESFSDVPLLSNNESINRLPEEEIRLDMADPMLSLVDPPPPPPKVVEKRAWIGLRAFQLALLSVPYISMTFMTLPIILSFGADVVMLPIYTALNTLSWVNPLTHTGIVSYSEQVRSEVYSYFMLYNCYIAISITMNLVYTVISFLPFFFRMYAKISRITSFSEGLKSHWARLFLGYVLLTLCSFLLSIVLLHSLTWVSIAIFTFVIPAWIVSAVLVIVDMGFVYYNIWALTRWVDRVNLGRLDVRLVRVLLRLAATPLFCVTFSIFEYTGAMKARAARQSKSEQRPARRLRSVSVAYLRLIYRLFHLGSFVMTQLICLTSGLTIKRNYVVPFCLTFAFYPLVFFNSVPSALIVRNPLKIKLRDSAIDVLVFALRLFLGLLLVSPLLLALPVVFSSLSENHSTPTNTTATVPELGPMVSLDSIAGAASSDYTISARHYSVCSQMWGALNVVDLALLSEYVYGDEEWTADERATFFSRYLPHLGPVSMARGDSADRVKWVNVFIKKQNLAVFSVRGTANLLDALEDVSLWHEGAILKIFLADIMPSEFVSLLIKLTAVPKSFQSLYHWDLNYQQPVVDALKDGGREGRSRTIVTGHSLGGGIGKIAAVATSHRAVTFASPGLQWSRRKFGLNWDSLTSDVLTVRPRGDIVSAIDKQGGNVQFVRCSKYDSVLSPLKCHSVARTACTLAMDCEFPAEGYKAFCVDNGFWTEDGKETNK
ncbi:Lipase (class 3) [Carpediemonas membranifera]|uniref:Lipase (Class 3) n=1 Tax=Carpediemonas membranifera TaxID=201153 RepID=A0A8J6ART8_9EUKA|nr:Lipase (class 3) [Carpediemonas membranifera]|eukprot:KAG9392716.1 Lipase (class 3) [Carpediemonas membranifera]